jgi:hypothetical protein
LEALSESTLNSGALYDENQSGEHEISSDPLTPLNGWSLSQYRIDLGYARSPTFTNRFLESIRAATRFRQRRLFGSILSGCAARSAERFSRQGNPDLYGKWTECGFFLTFGAGAGTSTSNEAMSNELSAQDLLPPEIGLTLMGFEKSEQGWLVRAEGRTRSECPSCRTQSTARHSRYWRQLQDLPVQGKRVALQFPGGSCTR